MQAAIQTRDSVVRNWCIRFILASGLSFSVLAFSALAFSALAFPFFAAAEEPPANLTRLIAARETETAQAQSNYTYRQTVTMDELTSSGLAQGTDRGGGDIIFSPAQGRTA